MSMGVGPTKLSEFNFSTIYLLQNLYFLFFYTIYLIYIIMTKSIGKIRIIDRNPNVITGTDIFKELLRKIEETRNQ